MSLDPRAVELFEQALEFSGDERATFVDRACGEDEQLRRAVEELLAFKAESSDLLPSAPSQHEGMTQSRVPEDLHVVRIEPSGQADHTFQATSGDSRHHGRFLPGTRIANRYRIVSLVGHGGMGEVYRADDLKLGQTVALKFLPLEIAREPLRLQYFHNEVRMARQISHPNVCRVYDIGEVDGYHFISMEYVDGEDLKVLLSRIGRLQASKGLEIAQQICAGLGAAHQKNVIHRDLKPANIMIDGRGQVRITDFGLARSSEESGSDEMAGTPAYMSPEQLARGETSIQSDLYSLGLILHEIFSGEPVFKPVSSHDLRRLHRSSSPALRLESDVHSLVGSVIEMCLAKNPEDRPMSVLAVARQLPGVEPFAASLATGETPAPEMVAAAGGEGIVSLTTGVGLLLATLVGLLVCWLGSNLKLLNRLQFERHPQVLVERARDSIQAFGYARTPADSAWGLRARRHMPGIQDSQAKTPTIGLEFWYRQSPTVLNPQLFFANGRRNLGAVTDANPPMTQPGMVLFRCDVSGRLLEFQAIPPRYISPSATRQPEPPKWDGLLDEESSGRLGIVSSTLEETVSEWTPPMAYDRRAAWLAEYEDGSPIRIEAASYQGRLVRILVTSRAAPSTQPTSHLRWLFQVVGIAFMGTSAIVALFNVRLGRGDRVGARRLATFMFCCNLLLFALVGHHSFAHVSQLLPKAIAWGLFSALEMWLFYTALEPFVRRLWPENLISWCRALAGRLRDPMVGHRILIGVLAAVVIALTKTACISLANWFDIPPPNPARLFLDPLMGTGHALARIVAEAMNAIQFSLWLLLCVFVSWLVLRRRWAAILATTVFWVAFFVLAGANPIESFLVATVIGIRLAVLVRFGLLPVVFATLCEHVLGWPMTTDTTSWYFSIGVTAVLIVASVAVYGALTSIRSSAVRSTGLGGVGRSN